MGAETLEGGDMINGPPTALGEAQTPPRPAAAHPHPIPSYSIPISTPVPSQPPSKRHHSPGLIAKKPKKKKPCKNRGVHSRQARHKQPHRKYDFSQIPALGAGRFLRHRAFHILPFNDDGWTMTSLRNVNSSQIRKPETHPPGIPWRGIHKPVIRTSAKNAKVFLPH